MKCRACGSDDVTQSKGQCNECLWVYEQEKKNVNRSNKKRLDNSNKE